MPGPDRALDPVFAPGAGRGRVFDRTAPYVLAACAAVLLGLLFGALAVNALSVPERVGLADQLRRLQGLGWAAPAVRDAWLAALEQNLKVLGWVYALGISVAGLPLIPGVLFFRGFVVGFAAAVAASGHVGWALWATLGIADGLLLAAWTAAGGLAMRFSRWLWQGVGDRRWGLALERFAAYTLATLALAVAVALGSTAQAILVPGIHGLAGLFHLR